MNQLTALVNTWVSLAQGIVGSLGALALLSAFVWRMVAAEPRSASEARRWIGRILVSTVGAEVAGTLTHVLLSTIPSGMH